MHVASVTESEIRLTLEIAFAIANDIDGGTGDTRSSLDEVGFSRAAAASAASVKRLDERLEALLPLLHDLPELSPVDAATRINEELTELPISPSIVDHDGVGHHIHWTPATTTFDNQVMADILMAFAQEVCENGTIRFGRCDADGCDRLFYDGTRNRSRRFCSDSRCASRTHTADHRARQKAT